jgi:hypothetical protein
LAISEVVLTSIACASMKFLRHFQEQLAASEYSGRARILVCSHRVFSDAPLHYPCGNRLYAIFHSCHTGHIDRGNPNFTPFAGSFYSLTGGVNYYPHPNVTIRPEVRYDWFAGGRNPYNDGQKDNQVLVAINVYLQF